MLQEKKGNCLRKRASLNRPFAFLFLLWCRATLKDGREVCLDPTAPWVKLIIKAILDKWVFSSLWAQIIKEQYFEEASKHPMHKLFKILSHKEVAIRKFTDWSKYCVFFVLYIIRFSPLVHQTSYVHASYNSHKAQVYWKLKRKCPVLWKFRR